MNRIIILYGLLAGLIVSAILAFGTTSMMHQEGCGGAVMYAVGFGSMLLAFSLIFVAVRKYRNQLPGGQISFWKAFSIGFWISFICSACYTITWAIIYKNFYPTFLDDMNAKKMASLKEAGASAAEILKTQKELDSMKEMYATWPGLLGITMMEILPVGILVALICAFVYSRKKAATSNLP